MSTTCDIQIRETSTTIRETPIHAAAPAKWFCPDLFRIDHGCHGSH